MKFSFSQQEIKDITLSAIVLAYAFGGLKGFLSSLLIVGSVFILHELGHKFTAQHFGMWAEYRKWNLGLLIAIISSFFGAIFAAPGAVYIQPYRQFAWVNRAATRMENGLIALAGPAVNIVLGFIFLACMHFFNIGILYTAARISFFIALFNMLPFGPLDGEKISAWDWKVWIVTIGLAGTGYVLLGMI